MHTKLVKQDSIVFNLFGFIEVFDMPRGSGTRTNASRSARNLYVVDKCCDRYWARVVCAPIPVCARQHQHGFCSTRLKWKHGVCMS